MEKEVIVTVPADTTETPITTIPSTEKIPDQTDNNESQNQFSVVSLIIGLVIGLAIGACVSLVVIKKKQTDSTFRQELELYRRTK